ncbi:hypothetical protein [Thiohalomonas denitrificans]|uniref:SoxXA-binding protein SoxK n=1 Tax=Thiohalomonas denitrificans TaxID=415747 RepID=A0A1G5Q1L2_9GAMM|nr:hypothetical protein [Thiohalomonas denitrificans]SCZ55547.1 hypothetical protein SAMN03097708_01148 [Thiohalomonas denitrificans]
MKTLVSLAAASLLVTACVSSPAEEPMEPATAKDVSAAVEAAEAARKQAASVGHEWRDTGKLIDNARSLMEEGKYDEAMALAEQAESQGELAYKQWQIESSR